jgi:hypothetical protein
MNNEEASKMSTWRRKIIEYEADLFRVHLSWWEKLFQVTTGGEIEIKVFEDGEKRMEIDLDRIKAPDGALLTVVIDGESVREVEHRRGSVHLRLSSSEGELIPDVRSGSPVEIRSMGETLLKGTFTVD